MIQQRNLDLNSMVLVQCVITIAFNFALIFISLLCHCFASFGPVVTNLDLGYCCLNDLSADDETSSIMS